MWLDGIPADFAFRMWDGDVDRLATYRRDAAARVPLLADSGVRRIVNGPVPYSPDGNPHLGPERGLRNFYHCNTFSFGIAQADGADKALAEWVVEGEPEWDLWRLDPRRYTDYATKDYVLSKAIETYQNQYAPAFPFAERPAGRPLRTSPLHDRLRTKGARFGVRGGWERAVCFDPTNATVAGACSFRRRRGWEKLVEAEACAVREAAGILDLPGLAKFQISGRGASAYLDRLVCSRLPSDGQISVSYALNPHGRIASELTITRLAADTFYAVGAAEAEWHDLDLLEGALPRDGSVRLEALSAELGTILLAGPRSREILERVSNADLSDAGFPWLSARHVQIGSTPLLALRVNAVGELGWEFHVPVARLDAVYAELWRAGEECGLRDFGLYAMESLRLEKCYRGWKTELGSDYSPLEASLDRFVEFSKADFVGRAAVMAEGERGPLRRLVPLTLDDAGDADAPCRASVFHGRERVGLVTSGGWSYTLQRAIALAYVRTDLAAPGTRVAVDVLGELRLATVGREPLVDPADARLRAL